ncbi:MAG: hypothetical protein ABIC04_03480 [Nanoarchaeota archaeon]
MARPAAHEEYLHNIGQLTPYRKALKAALEKIEVKEIDKGKANIEDLIKQIMEKTSKEVGKHFGDTEEHQFKLDYEQIVSLIETLQQEHGIKAGKLDEDVVAALVGQYHREASNYSNQKYNTHLRQMHIADARESVKQLFPYAKPAVLEKKHMADIDKTVKHSTLGSRVADYNDTLRPTIEKLHKDKQYTTKNGINLYKA